MEIIANAQRYEQVDGQMQFLDTAVVYREGEKFYHATTKSRWGSAADIKFEELSNAALIPKEACCPLFQSDYTRIPDPLPENCYVKKPCLLSYDPAWDSSRVSPMCKRIIREVQACEILKSNPHPNIATYLGCQVQDGRITGICYAKYSETLMQRVNPGSYMKRTVAYEGTDADILADALNELEKGVLHLHSLGLVHNDINPSNIMFDGDTFVLIDFDSCHPAGESLLGIGQTYEWYDESVQMSVPSNDLNALSEIREWMKVGGSKNFKFKA